MALGAPRWLGWSLFIAACAVCLSGCCFGGSAKITPVDPAILAAIVLYLKRKRGWDFGRMRKEREDLVRKPTDEQRRLDRHRGFFARRRAQWIGERNADLVAEVRDTPNWQDAPLPPRLVQRIEAELDATEAYHGEKVGTTRDPGPLGGGAGDNVPRHLDLDDVAHTHTFTSDGTARSRRKRYVRLRKQRVAAIIWRGAALHDEVWEPTSDRTSASIRRPVLDEMMDRRLRAIERMAFQVSSVPTLGRRHWRKPITGTWGPWRDRFRVRPFEYARLQRSSEPFSQFVPAIGEANIAHQDGMPFIPLPGEAYVLRVSVHGDRRKRSMAITENAPWRSPKTGMAIAETGLTDHRKRRWRSPDRTVRPGPDLR